jgi:uncharacterized protein YjiS (DUF1127 family)
MSASRGHPGCTAKTRMLTMTFITTTTIRPGRTRQPPRFLTALRNWLLFHDTIDRLDGLSDHMLRDIGIERGGISETARRSACATHAHTHPIR